MAQKIHFQDNLYQLSREIDCIAESFLIDTDMEFFGQHIMDCITFFHAVIKQISAILEPNGQFIDRLEQLRNLYTVQRKFLLLLSKLESPHMQYVYISNVTKITEIKNTQTQIQKAISDILQIDDSADNPQDVVSEEELSRLLQF